MDVKSSKSSIYNGLHPFTFEDVTLGDFLDARRFHAGFDTIEDLARAANVSRQTTGNILKKWMGTEDVRGYASTLEALAVALKFRDWYSATEAWRNNDLHVGLEGQAGILTVLLPKETFKRLSSRKRTTQESAAEIIERLLSEAPETKQAEPRKTPPKPPKK